MRISNFALAMGIVAAALLAAAEAQALDCRNARQPTERTICGDAKLLDLEKEVDTYYSLAADTASAAQLREIKQKNQAFLRERNRCGTNVSCIRKAYDDFIGYLLEELL